MQGEIDSDGRWDGKNITLRLDHGSLTLSNKRQNKTFGMVYTIYKDGRQSLGLNNDGKITGKWLVTRPDGSTFEKDYTFKSGDSRTESEQSFLKLDDKMPLEAVN